MKVNVTSMSVNRTLLRAAGYIKRHGWCQNGWFDGDSACVQGAIVMVNQADFYHAKKRLEDYLGTQNVGAWNDEPGRTQQQAIEALIKAAEIGEPSRRRVLIPQTVPAEPMTPDSPLWTDPAPEEPKRVPERVPA